MPIWSEYGGIGSPRSSSSSRIASELKDRLKDDLTTSMKARDELRSSTLRMVLTAITNAEVAGKQAKELSGGKADEQATLLTVCGGRIAKRALEERAEDVADAERGHSRANRGKTSTNESSRLGIHDKLLRKNA